MLKLTEAMIEDLNQEPKFLTRLVPEKYFQSWLDGGYRFGDTCEIQGWGKNALARLSDTSEGEARRHYQAAEGHYQNFVMPGITLKNVVVRNMPTGTSGVTAVHQANGMCSCLTSGRYDEDLAATFKAQDNGDLEAYIVYSYVALKHAIEEIASERPSTSNFRIIGRHVDYRSKDAWLTIPAKHDVKPDTLTTWSEAAFVKPWAF